jgi:hypothetical protein
MMTRKLNLVYLYSMATAGTIKWILPCIGYLGMEHLGEILALPAYFVLLRYHGTRPHQVTQSLTARSANQSINQSIIMRRPVRASWSLSYSLQSIREPGGSRRRHDLSSRASTEQKMGQRSTASLVCVSGILLSFLEALSKIEGFGATYIPQCPYISSTLLTTDTLLSVCSIRASKTEQDLE